MFSDPIIKLCGNRLSQFLSLISNFRSCFQKISMLFLYCWHLICFFSLHDISWRLHLFSYFLHKTHKIFFIFRKLYNLYLQSVSSDFIYSFIDNHLLSAYYVHFTTDLIINMHLQLDISIATGFLKWILFEICFF